MTDSRKVRLDAEFDASGVRRGTAEVESAVRGMAQTVQQQGAAAAKGIDGIGAGAAGTAEKLDRVTASFLRQIQKVTAATQAGSSSNAEFIESFAKLRGADLNVLAPALAKLRESEVAARAAAGGLDKIGVSAAQTQAALRGVPAQFTDIISSLQGGQAPLSVFLQQGGQLKDMFGGAGAAAKALGGYVIGLITPVTAAAAAVAVLAYAYHSGVSEGQEFRKTVILSGGAAGVSAGQLSDMAQAIGKIGGATQGKAAEVLNAVAAFGAVGADNLQRFTVAAIQLERVGGPAATETAKAFAELAKSPLQASLKLNESTNYLTAAVVQQIHALEQQGRTLEAGKVAQEAYFNAATSRVPALEANLGSLERTWRTLGDAAKHAWDKILNVGREATPADQTRALEDRIADLQRKLDGDPTAAMMRRGGGGRWTESRAETEATLEGLREQQRLLARSTAATQDIAAANAQNRVQVQATVDWQKQGDALLSREQRLLLEIDQTRRNGVAMGLTEVQIATRIAELRDKSDPGVNLQAIRNAEAMKLEVLKRSQIQVDTLRATGMIREREAIERSTEIELQAIAIRRAAVSAELALVAKRKDSAREVRSLEGEQQLLDAQSRTVKQQGIAAATEALYKQRMATLAVVAAEREQIELDISRSLVEQSQARERVGLALAAYAEDLEAANGQLQIEAAFVGRSTAAREIALEQYRIELDLKRRIAEIDATAYDGGPAEREQVKAQARALAAKAAAQANSRVWLAEWERTTDSINQSLTDALLQSFEDGKGFAKNFRNAVQREFANLVLRPIISAAVQPVSGALTTALLGNGDGSGKLLDQAGQLTGLVSKLTSLYQAAGTYFGSTAAAGSGLAVTAANSGYSLYGSGSALGIRAGTTAGTISTGSATTGSAAAGAGSTGASGIAASTWVGLAIAALSRGSSEYDAGWTAEQAARAKNNIFGEDAIGQSFSKFSVDAVLTKLGTAMGMSDKWASIFSGATAAAQLFGRKAPQVTSQGISGTLGGGDFSGNAYQDILEKGGWFRSDKRYTNTSAVSDEMDRFFDTAAASVLSKAKEYGAALGLPAEQLSAVTRSIRVELSGDAERNKTAIYDALAGYGEDLVAGFADSLAPVKLYGESITQTIERVGGAIKTTNDVLAALGQAALGASVAGGQAAIDLQNLFGGADAFGQSAGQYLRDFFSEAEQAALTTSALQKQLSAVGVEALPASREAYRSLAEAQDLTTESGRRTYAALLQLAPAFASVVPAVESTADAMAQAAQRVAEAGAKALATLAADRASLQVDLLRAQGRSSEANALQRTNELGTLTAGLSSNDAAAAAAAYDYNVALREQTLLLQEAAAASAAAANERNGLEGSLLQMQGDTAALRARELATLAPANRELQQRIYVLQDLQAVEAQAAAAAAVAAQQAQATASQRSALEQQLLQMQGETAALRDRELAALEPVNRELQRNIYSLQDLQAAQSAAAEAASVAAQQAQAAANQRNGLEQQLLQLQGDTAALRARELAALEPVNRELQQHVYALQDLQAAQSAAAEAASVAAQQAQAAASQRNGLEQQLLQLQGDTAGLRARELAALEPANRELQQHVYALQDLQAAQSAAAEAASVAAQQAEAAANQRSGLEQQLLQLQGDTAALRLRELAAIDPANRALQERIYALQDAQASEQAATQSLQHLRDILSSLSDTRFDLENQVLTSQGDAAEVTRRTRERDLARLTAGLSAEEASRVTAAYDLNAALRLQIEGINAAQQEAQRAAQAADQLRQGWQSAADGIFAEVQRIQQAMLGDTPQSYSEAQARFAVASAQARAGDQEVAKQLPTLSRLLLELAEGQAGSYTELQRMRAAVAASLQQTGYGLATTYGVTAPSVAPPPVTPAPASTADAAFDPASMVQELQALRSQNRAMQEQQERWLRLVERWERDGMPETRSVA